MDNKNTFYIPIIIILVVMMNIILTTIAIRYTKKNLAIFKKVIKHYIILAILIITMFGGVYFITILYDINITLTNNEKLVESIHKYKDNKESKEYADTLNALSKEFIKRSHFTNVSLDYLKLGNEGEVLKKYFFDSIYFSAITFFTIGYGDVCPIGVMRLFIIIEGFLGAGFTPIFIALALTNEDEISKNKNTQKEEEQIRIRLNRGENIVGVFKTKFKYDKIVLIDKLGVCNRYSLMNINSSFEDLLEKFQVQYNFSNMEYDRYLYYSFAIYVNTCMEEIILKKAICIKKPIIYNKFDIDTAFEYFKELRHGLKDNNCEKEYYIDYLGVKNMVEDAFKHLNELMNKR